MFTGGGEFAATATTENDIIYTTEIPTTPKHIVVGGFNSVEDPESNEGVIEAAVAAAKQIHRLESVQNVHAGCNYRAEEIYKAKIQVAILKGSVK